MIIIVNWTSYVQKIDAAESRSNNGNDNQRPSHQQFHSQEFWESSGDFSSKE